MERPAQLTPAHYATVHFFVPGAHDIQQRHRQMTAAQETSAMPGLLVDLQGFTCRQTSDMQRCPVMSVTASDAAAVARR